MTLPRHISWADREPAFKGDFGIDLSTTKEIPEGDSSLTFNLDAANICLIYKLDITPTPSGSYTFQLFEKDAFESDDIIFSTAQSEILQGKDLICYVDKDGTSEIHCKIIGVASTSYQIDMKMIRFR